MTFTHRTGRNALAAFVAVLALSACGTEPEQLDPALIADMALLAADATIEDVNLWGSSVSAGAPAAAESQYDAGTTTMNRGMPGGHHGWNGTLSGTRSKTFYDENGVEMASYDELLTESIVIEHEIEGEVSRGGWSATVYRARNKTVSGLLGEETTRTWNGTGESDISRSRHLDDGTERSYEMTGTVAYEDVVVPIPGSDPRWPLSGTVRRSMDVTRTNGEETMTRSVEIVIVFNGTNLVEMTVNGEVREIDLSERDGRNPVRPPRG